MQGTAIESPDMNSFTNQSIFKTIKWGEYVCPLSLFIFFLCSIKPLPAFQFTDGFWLWMPRLSFAAKEILKGTVPYWNEFQFCGVELLVDGTTNILNPTTVFYFFLTPDWAYTSGMVVLFFFLILGTWKYFRIRGFSQAASTIGSIGFVFGGQIIFWCLYHGMNLSLALFPWILFAFRKFEQRGRVAYLILAFILIFLNSVGGFIQFALFMAVTVLVEGVEDFSLSSIKNVFRYRFPTVLLAILSASIIIMPTIKSAMFSHRGLVPYIKQLLPKVSSLFYMHFWADSFGSHHYPNYFYYIGIVLLALAIFGIRKNLKKVFSCPFFVYSITFPCILVAVYTDLLPTSFQFGVESDPFRGMFIFIFFLSILAAHGIDSYLEGIKKKRKLMLPPFELFLAGLISLIIGILLTFSHKEDKLNSVAVFNNVTVLGICIIAGFALVIFLRKTSKLTRDNEAAILSIWFFLLMLRLENGV